MTSLIFVSLVVIFTSGASGQDIQFPEDSEIAGILTGSGPEPTERIPIHVPDRCPTNMILYPGDGDKSIWICDCIVGYLYFPLNNTCHQAYRQGPCEPENYVILPPGEVVPKCERNPCLQDGLVPYNNTCSQVKSTVGPCPRRNVLDINETTFQLECVPVSIDEHHIIDVPANRCPNGSRRNALGQCRKMI